jgi:hypothetical protein
MGVLLQVHACKIESQKLYTVPTVPVEAEQHAHLQSAAVAKSVLKEASHVVVDLRWPRQARGYSNFIHRDPSDNPSTAAM